jgi:methanogenic corrinoid protein MtbC1
MGKRSTDVDWDGTQAASREGASVPSTPESSDPKLDAAQWAITSVGVEGDTSDPKEALVSRTSAPRSELLRAIEEQLVPRLMLAHREDSPAFAACPDQRMPPTEQEVATVADHATREDITALVAHVETAARDGLSLETILLDLVAPAARLLGQQWLDDERSFADVTIGLGALQRIVATLGHNAQPPAQHRGLVVLCNAPGEQHTLAIQLLGELLRSAGWGAYVEPGISEPELLSLVSAEHVVMVGISISNTELLKPTERLVKAVKKASINPSLPVMLGGPLDISEYASSIGAIACSDGRDALKWLAENAH